MRKATITRLIFFASIAAACGVWVACSSDEATPAKVDTRTDASSPPPTEPSEPEEPRRPEPPDGATMDAGGGKVYDAGDPTVLDAGDIDGGVPCVVGGALEQEPNDDRPSANVLAPTRCGVVRVTGDAGESDFLTFSLGDASTSFYLQYAGDVRVLVETDGSAPVDITQGSPVLPFFKGQPYFLEVKSKDNTQQTWRVTLFEEQK